MGEVLPVCLLRVFHDILTAGSTGRGAMSVRIYSRKLASATCITPAHNGEEDDARDGDDVRGSALNSPPNSPGSDKMSVGAIDDGWWVLRLGIGQCESC